MRRLNVLSVCEESKENSNIFTPYNGDINFTSIFNASKEAGLVLLGNFVANPRMQELPNLKLWFNSSLETMDKDTLKAIFKAARKGTANGTLISTFAKQFASLNPLLLTLSTKRDPDPEMVKFVGILLDEWGVNMNTLGAIRQFNRRTFVDGEMKPKVLKVLLQCKVSFKDVKQHHWNINELDETSKFEALNFALAIRCCIVCLIRQHFQNGSPQSLRLNPGSKRPL